MRLLREERLKSRNSEIKGNMTREEMNRNEVHKYCSNLYLKCRDVGRKKQFSCHCLICSLVLFVQVRQHMTAINCGLSANKGVVLSLLPIENVAQNKEVLSVRTNV